MESLSLKDYVLVLNLDAPKLDYTLRSQDHRILAFKSTLHQHTHQVNS